MISLTGGKGTLSPVMIRTMIVNRKKVGLKWGFISYISHKFNFNIKHTNGH